VAYVVYEDDPTDRARIHLDTCRHYLNRKPDPLPDNRWHGPFPSLEKAWAVVRSPGKRDISECGHCLKS